MSLSLDFTSLLEQAGVLINNLWPVFIIPVGIALGMGLLSKIISEIRKAF